MRVNHFRVRAGDLSRSQGRYGVEWLVERLIGLLPAISTLQKDKREVADAALSSIAKALNETALYVAHIDETETRDRSREEELARLWAAAAIPTRHVDDEFSEICQYKSEIWVNPSNWDQQRIREWGLDLRTVADRYKRLLRNH